MKRIATMLLGSILLYVTSTSAQDSTTTSEAKSTLSAQPRQVILLIGDGMDEQQITIARNYLKGASGQLLLDSMALRSAVQIQTTEDSVNGKPVYVADSANTATTLATGEITSIGRISTSAGDDQDLITIAELSSAAGLRTGIVSTASVTDATPAAFAAHISLRLCQDSDTMVDIRYRGFPLGECEADLKVNGGKGSIAEQLADSSLDVILGGGARYFAPNAEGGSESIAQLAKRNGFTVVSTATELAAAPAQGKILGLFSPSTMPVRLQGEDGREAETPTRSWLNHLHPYLGSIALPTPMTCVPNPDFKDGIPTLLQMTTAALEHLSADNDKGFFLMIESASIDKQAHERKPCGSIGEMAQLDEALAAALAFAKIHPQTLIIVTADHAQAAQLVPHDTLFSVYPVPIATPGKLARITTPEGSLMAVNYATNDFVMEEHSGAAVPLFSNREGVGRIPAFIQQRQIFTIARDYLGL